MLIRIFLLFTTLRVSIKQEKLSKVRRCSEKKITIKDSKTLSSQYLRAGIDGDDLLANRIRESFCPRQQMTLVCSLAFSDFFCFFSCFHILKDLPKTPQITLKETKTELQPTLLHSLVEFSPLHHIPPVSINIETVILITNTITFLP